MKIEDVPYCVTELSAIPPTEHPGTTGTSLWHTWEAGKPGMSYQVSNDVAPHRSSTTTGAKVFIVD